MLTRSKIPENKERQWLSPVFSNKHHFLFLFSSTDWGNLSGKNCRGETEPFLKPKYPGSRSLCLTSQAFHKWEKIAILQLMVMVGVDGEVCDEGRGEAFGSWCWQLLKE